MPAATSSPIHPVLDHLVDAVDHDRVAASLLATLAQVPDPRARRGVRHQIAAILALAACAVMAGARSFTAIGEWAADASDQVLSALGVESPVPCESPASARAAQVLAKLFATPYRSAQEAR